MWSNQKLCDVIPTRPCLDKHHGISLCSTICARIICILGFRPSHQTACSRTGSRPLQANSHNLSEALVRRLDYILHKPSVPFSSFFHLLISSIDNYALSLQHHHPQDPTVSFGAWRMKLKIDCRGATGRMGWGMLLRTKISHPLQTSTPWQSKQFASWNWEESRIWRK